MEPLGWQCQNANLTGGGDRAAEKAYFSASFSGTGKCRVRRIARDILGYRAGLLQGLVAIWAMVDAWCLPGGFPSNSLSNGRCAGGCDWLKQSKFLWYSLISPYWGSFFQLDRLRRCGLGCASSRWRGWLESRFLVDWVFWLDDRRDFPVRSRHGEKQEFQEIRINPSFPNRPSVGYPGGRFRMVQVQDGPAVSGRVLWEQCFEGSSRTG